MIKQVLGNQQLTSVVELDDQTIDMQPVSRIWYRLDAAGESQHAYAYFKAYLAMQAPRNISRLARHLRMQRSGIARFASIYNWAQRAAAYDDWHTDIELTRMRRNAERRERVWEERRDEQREAEWQIAQALLDKVRQMLTVPLFTETVTEMLKGIDPDGRIIVEQVIRYEPLDWGATDMARFFDVASKMARLATGMDTDQKKLRIDVSTLTDDELERLAANR